MRASNSLPKFRAIWMTNIVAAQEAAVAAETRIEHLLTGAIDLINKYNHRLLDIHTELKKVQPVASGSICLELYPCGKGCTGCPHPRWVKYRWADENEPVPGRLIATNLDAAGRDPVLALSRKAPYYKQAASLVREAKTILVARSKLLASIKSLRYQVPSVAQESD